MSNNAGSDNISYDGFKVFDFIIIQNVIKELAIFKAKIGPNNLNKRKFQVVNECLEQMGLDNENKVICSLDLSI